MGLPPFGGQHADALVGTTRAGSMHLPRGSTIANLAKFPRTPPALRLGAKALDAPGGNNNGGSPLTCGRS